MLDVYYLAPKYLQVMNWKRTFFEKHSSKRFFRADLCGHFCIWHPDRFAAKRCFVLGVTFTMWKYVKNSFIAGKYHTLNTSTCSIRDRSMKDTTKKKMSLEDCLWVMFKLKVRLESMFFSTCYWSTHSGLAVVSLTSSSLQGLNISQTQVRSSKSGMCAWRSNIVAMQVARLKDRKFDLS